MTDKARGGPLWLDPNSPLTTVDESSPSTQPVLGPQVVDGAEEWGLGHPKSEAARRAAEQPFAPGLRRMGGRQP